MAAAYSYDLREKAVSAVDRGQSNIFTSIFTRSKQDRKILGEIKKTGRKDYIANLNNIETLWLRILTVIMP